MTKTPGFFEGTGMPDPDWWEALWPDPEKVLIDAGLKSGMSVVDLCAGDGWFTLPIARIARHVTAIDIDAKLLEAARTRLSNSNLRNCDTIVGDAYDLAGLVATPVDFVFLANAFHGAPDKPRLAKAVRSILKVGGRFAIVNWQARPREETRVLGQARGPASDLRMTPEATIKEVEPSGLTLCSVIEIPAYHYAAIFENPL